MSFAITLMVLYIRPCSLLLPLPLCLALSWAVIGSTHDKVSNLIYLFGSVAYVLFSSGNSSSSVSVASSRSIIAVHPDSETTSLSLADSAVNRVAFPSSAPVPDVQFTSSSPLPSSAPASHPPVALSSASVGSRGPLFVPTVEHSISILYDNIVQA